MVTGDQFIETVNGAIKKIHSLGDPPLEMACLHDVICGVVIVHAMKLGYPDAAPDILDVLFDQARGQINKLIEKRGEDEN